MEAKLRARSADAVESRTLCAGLLVQVGDEFAPHLLVSSQSEGVGQQGCGVQVVHLARHGCCQTAQTALDYRVLSHKMSCKSSQLIRCNHLIPLQRCCTVSKAWQPLQ